MTTETSRNATYAPFAQWSARQAPVPQATHNLPGTIPASASVSTSLIKSDGFSLISAGVTMTQTGSVSIQRYLDDGGTQPQGAAITVPLAANVAGNIDVLDGKPFSAFVLTVTNAAASVATINGFALLLQASVAGATDSAGDGSAAVATGGAAQLLFGGAVPVNGFAVYNPDPSNDLWVSDSATAAANGQGSIRVAAGGGGYETPLSYKPVGAVSIVGAVTGQKITARRW